MESLEQEQQRGWGRRLLFLGAALGALGGGAALLRRRRQASESGPREIGGPVIGDVEFLEDERYVFSAYKDVMIGGGPTRVSYQDRKSTRLNSSHAHISY